MVKEIVTYFTDKQHCTRPLDEYSQDGNLYKATQLAADSCGRACQIAAWIDASNELVTVCPSLEQPDRVSAVRQEAICTIAHRLVFQAMEASSDASRLAEQVANSPVH